MQDFDQVDAALVGADMQAAEAQGMLLGMLCARGELTQELWWSRVHENADQNPDHVPEPVASMFVETVASLGEADGTFDLMLPDDEAELAQRADALHAWCYGFMYGYGVAGGEDPAKLPEESAELLRDVAQFAQASFDLGENAEDDELAYSELVEYVRVGVMLLYETRYPRAQVRPSEAIDPDEPLDIDDLWAQIAQARSSTLH